MPTEINDCPALAMIHTVPGIIPVFNELVGLHLPGEVRDLEPDVVFEVSGGVARLADSPKQSDCATARRAWLAGGRAAEATAPAPPGEASA